MDVTHSDRETGADMAGPRERPVRQRLRDDPASSLLASLSYEERGEAWVMIGALLATALVFALALVLSTLLGGGRVREVCPAWPTCAPRCASSGPCCRPPGRRSSCCWAPRSGCWGSDTAVTIALVVNTAILFVWGVAVARVHGATPALMLAVGALACGLGAALVLLKLALH